MPMTDTELSRVADALHALRPDWPTRSVRAWLAANLRDRTYADVAVAAAAVAVDPRSKTPARLAETGPWWGAAQAARAEPTPAVTSPPCERHADQPTSRCRRCEAEAAPPPADWRPDRRPPTSHDDLAQTLPALLPDATTQRCRCRASYLDTPDGHDAHRAVFGHPPIEPAPAVAEAAL